MAASRSARLLVLAVLAVLAVMAACASAPTLAHAADRKKVGSGAKPTPWEAMRYFAGSWTGTGTGQPGSSTVKREYRFILNDRFLEVLNHSTYSPQEIHEECRVFSWDRARRRFVLRQFHVLGFVIQYVADSVATGAERLVFTSDSIENLPAGFRARETYRILGPDEFVERVEIAEPGKEFTLYSETVLRRVK